MALGAHLAWPRLSLSLWDDEEYSVRRTIRGGFERDREGNLEFEPVRWRETFWQFRNARNHALHSILARLSLSASHVFAKPTGLGFNCRGSGSFPAFPGGPGDRLRVAIFLRRTHAPGSAAATDLPVGLLGGAASEFFSENQKGS